MKRIAGCEVGGNDLEKVNKENRDVYDLMIKKYGEDWMQKFENETGLKLALSYD